MTDGIYLKMFHPTEAINNSPWAYEDWNQNIVNKRYGDDLCFYGGTLWNGDPTTPGAGRSQVVGIGFT